MQVKFQNLQPGFHSCSLIFYQSNVKRTGFPSFCSMRKSSDSPLDETGQVFWKSNNRIKNQTKQQKINETALIFRLPSKPSMRGIMIRRNIDAAYTRQKLYSTNIFFCLGFLLIDIHESQDSSIRGRPIFITLYHFYPLHEHLDISWTITAESSHLLPDWNREPLVCENKSLTTLFLQA